MFRRFEALNLKGYDNIHKRSYKIRRQDKRILTLVRTYFTGDKFIALAPPASKGSKKQGRAEKQFKTKPRPKYENEIAQNHSDTYVKLSKNGELNRFKIFGYRPKKSKHNCMHICVKLFRYRILFITLYLVVIGINSAKIEKKYSKKLNKSRSHDLNAHELLTNITNKRTRFQIHHKLFDSRPRPISRQQFYI